MDMRFTRAVGDWNVINVPPSEGNLGFPTAQRILPGNRRIELCDILDQPCNQLGEFESGTTAAWLGPVGSVVLGGVGVLLVAGLWPRLFPALARRDALLPDGTGQRHPAG